MKEVLELGFFCCFMLIAACCLLIVSLDGYDMETTISSVFACDVSKLVLSAAMLINQLEIYPIIIFLAPLFHLPRLRKGNKNQ